jgi:hypothetical protein
MLTQELRLACGVMIGGSEERRRRVDKMLVIGRNGRSTRLVGDKLLALRHAWPDLAQERDSAAGI